MLAMNEHRQSRELTSEDAPRVREPPLDSNVTCEGDRFALSISLDFSLEMLLLRTVVATPGDSSALSIAAASSSSGFKGGDSITRKQ